MVTQVWITVFKVISSLPCEGCGFWLRARQSAYRWSRPGRSITLCKGCHAAMTDAGTEAFA